MRASETPWPQPRSRTCLNKLFNPVERIISTYYFAMRTKDHPRHHQVQGMSLMDFAADQDDLEMENYQVRLLGGNPRDPAAVAEMERAKSNNEPPYGNSTPWPW